MMWLTRAVFGFVVSCGFATAAQEESPPAAEPHFEFVSGTVAELPPGKIIVNRANIGKPAENRTFLINGDTKVEGKLRPRARVTVGFKPTDEGEVAVRIIVRAQHPAAPAPKKP